ncbi:MAG: DnaJ domain-containing protein, partial [Minisyncoccales bacterium]
MASKDYYKILGVEKGASKEDIKKAYKKLAKKYHPDISKETDAETKFKEINEAAGVLLDDQKKQQYDTYGTADGPQGFGGFGGGGFNPGDFGINIDDIFEQFGFGGFGGFGGRSNRRQNSSSQSPLYSEIDINLEDVYFGVEKNISITKEKECSECNGLGAENPGDIKTCETCNGAGMTIETQRSILGLIRTQKVCSTCHGTGQTIKNPCKKCGGSKTEKSKETITIKIPKGIETGTTLRVPGKGNFNPETQTYTDLYVKIFDNEDPNYQVDGRDLYKNLEINFIQAILG